MCIRDRDITINKCAFLKFLGPLPPYYLCKNINVSRETIT
jgi:hypothetical protein